MTYASSKMQKNYRAGGFSVTFPLSSVTKYRVRYTRLEVHQKIREHDTAVVRVRSKNMDWFRQFSSGTPVMISYWATKNRSSKAYFYGYVTHVRLVTDEDNAYVRDVVCVAASRDLRETAQRTYTNKSASEIVSEIGRMFRFNVVTKQHGLRRSTVVQAGETYWEFLNKLAKRTGYVLRVEGTTIFFLPIGDLIRANLARTVTLTDYTRNSNAVHQTPTIQHIDSWVGDTSDDAERLSDQAVFTSIAPETGEVSVVRQRPTSTLLRNRQSRSKFERYLSSTVVAHSRYDAELLAKGAADNGLMAIDVDLQVLGDPDLGPYRPVELSLKDRSLSGYWVVKEVTHCIVKGTEAHYTCDVTVSTDAVDGARYVRAPRTATRDLATEVIQGFSRYEDRDTRLTATRDGFVSGVTSGGNASGRWVHR